MTDGLTFEGVRRNFGAVAALRGVTWAAPLGTITCVLGPNGAGKSTSIACATGLLRPDAGTVSVLGQDPWRSPAEHRARVGVMLQDAGLPNTRAARDVLRHFAALYPRERATALADVLDIASFGRTPVRRLSGGQRQRLALAVALVGYPELAFLDEPTAGLDPHGRLQVWQLLRQERDRGAGLVVSTHSFEEAERLADTVVVIHRGEVVTRGTPAELAAGHPSGTLEGAYFAATGVQA